MRRSSRFSLTLMAVLGLSFAWGCSQPVATSSNPDSASPAAVEPDPTQASLKAEPTNEAESQKAKASDRETLPADTQAIAQVPPEVFAENNIAIRGADPVASFTQSRYVAGSADYSYDWAGATWQFSSAENRDLFASNPQQYAPQYGGFCAWAVAEGYTAAVDPNAWEIVDGKLYLNYDARIQRRWQRDIPNNIARADQNWPGVLN